MPDQIFLARQTHILCASYLRWTGLPLLEEPLDSAQAIQQLLHAPFAVVSHDMQPEPVFNYANIQAQQLFGMSWAEITQLPSRYSAGEMDRNERDRLLQRVTENGYVNDYSGIRIAKNGARFRIHDATVWNLFDETQTHCGQAALIRHWTPI